MSTEGNSSDGIYCYNFSTSAVEAAYYTKLCVASLGILAASVVIIMICASKVYRQFVYRLVLYLMLTNLFQAVALVVEVIPVVVEKDGEVTVREGWGRACAAFGFIDQIASWMGIITILWIMFYLLWLSYKLRRLQNGKVEPPTVNSSDKPYQQISKAEMGGIVALLILPFTLNWIPFIWDMYGLSGPWCWIKSTGNNCEDYKLGLTLMMIVLYGPLVFMVTFSFISMLVIAAIFCRGAKMRRGSIRKKYSKGIAEMVLIAFYPTIYNILCLILIVNRAKEAISISHQEPPFFPLWMAGAIADPSRVLLPPLAFLLHPKSWKTIFCKRRSSDSSSDTRFTIPPEDDDIKESVSVRQSKKSAYAYGALVELSASSC